MGYICPKNPFFQLKHIKRIYLTLLSTTCVKIHQIPYSFQLAYIILAQALHTFDKNILSKCTFSDFPLLVLKFINFLRSFFKQKMSFYSKFGSLFSVMRDNSSALFQLKIYMLLTTTDKSSTSKYKFSDLPLLALKFTKLVMPFLKP